MKTFHCYELGNSVVLIWHHWRDRQVGLEKIAMKMRGTTAGFCDMKNLARSLSRHETSTHHIENQIALKTFGSTRTGLALFEQTGETENQRHNAQVRKSERFEKTSLMQLPS